MGSNETNPIRQCFRFFCCNLVRFQSKEKVKCKVSTTHEVSSVHHSQRTLAILEPGNATPQIPMLSHRGIQTHWNPSGHPSLRNQPKSFFFLRVMREYCNVTLLALGGPQWVIVAQEDRSWCHKLAYPSFLQRDGGSVPQRALGTSQGVSMGMRASQTNTRAPSRLSTLLYSRALSHARIHTRDTLSLKQGGVVHSW